MNQSDPKRATVASLVLFLAFLAYFFSAAHWVPSQFGIDGYVISDAVDYYAQERRIPIVDANDQEIQFTQIGTTRLLRPPLTYILSAAIVEATASTPLKKSVRYRMTSVILAALSVTALFATCFLLTKHLALSFIGALLLGLLPRFTILASTKNDDIGAITTVAVLLLAIVWWRQSYSKNAMLFLAAALGMVFISKYTAWLCFFGFTVMLLPEFRRFFDISPRYFLIAFFLCVIFGLWWPLWNMFHYGWFDPSALQHAAEIQRSITGSEANRRGYWSHGVSLIQLLQNHDGFLSRTLQSLVGSLWWLKANVVGAHLWFYFSLIVLGFCACLLGSIIKNRQRWFYAGILMLSVVVLTSFVHHNLLRDVQADGRYLLPILGPLIAGLLCALNQRFHTILHEKNNRTTLFGVRTALATVICLTVILYIFSMQSLLNAV